MRRNGSSAGAGCLVVLAVTAALIAAFVWYANTIIPHTTPTVYTNFWWGWIHGFFIVPTFFYSLFVHGITIYQAPNDGGWYNFGYLWGASVALGGTVSASKRARRR